MEQMNIDVPPPPAYSADPSKITYAEVATKMGKSIEHDTTLSDEHNTALNDVLGAFKNFLSSEEKVRLSKNSLQVLKNQSVLVLEAVPGYMKSGEDASAILAAVSSIFNAASQELRDKEQWETVLQDPSGVKNLENIIGSAFENLEKQLEKIQGRQEESTMYRDELLKAQKRDRHKIAELEEIIDQITRPGETLKNRVEISMAESLKIIGDPTVVHQQIDAKRSLAILAELTGKSLPPSTLLGKEFVTIGSHAIHQGSSYDIFEGEYFTGEKIAIKVLRHRVDEATAERMHQRFARQALNWSALRHDAILPFYGLGVTPSPVADGEFQLYMVSPYLQNQDVRRYLKKYPTATNATRVQIVLDVARGLNHMHVGADLPEPGNGIVHSALNIFNVLIKDSGRAVISGFGHSKVIKDFQESFTGDNSEYRYMGPELMLDDPHLTHGTDMWAWAMTALEILTDVPAFGEKTKGPRIIQMVSLGKRPSRKDHPKLEKYVSPDELWSLFEECWDQEPGDRPSAEDAVRRLRPILTELGKRADPVKQGQDSQPTGREPISSQLGRADPPVKSGKPPPVVQDELGRGAPPAVQSEPPPQIPAKMGNQLGKSDPANVQAPNPPKP